MVSKNTVLRSINIQDEGRCVDIFRRADGTYGFEEFRRDAEDNRGWFPIGYFGDRVFQGEDEALLDARSRVGWLDDVLDGG